MSSAETPPPGPPPGTEPPLLASVRVLDASRVLAGPYCAQVLGDLGAEVIKIERPGSGDDTRAWGPPFLGELSAYFLSCNRNKRSLTLNLNDPEGADLFRELVRSSDVVLENFRAASAAHLGLTPDRLLALNPQLVICSISGYGRTGPLSELPGYDFAIQALSGLMSITGPPEGPPYKVGVALTDVLTGLHAAIAILACLHARRTSGHGYAIDLALLDCALAAQVNMAQAYLTSGESPPRQGNAHLQIVPYQLFATADGWLVLAVGNDGQWHRFCAAAGVPELADHPDYRTNPQRVAHRQTLVPRLEPLLRARTTAQWQEILLAAEVSHAPVWTYRDLLAHPQVAARQMRVTVHDPDGQPVELLGSPFHIAGGTLPPPRVPPRLGADTSAILREMLGLEEEQIEGLRGRGVV